MDASKIALNERVVSIDTKNHIVETNKRTIQYDHLISTIPFTRLLKLCQLPYNQKVLTSNKVLVFNLGFDGKGLDTKNHWIYFPEKKYCFYRVGFYSNTIPADRMSLYVEIGFNSNAALDIDNIYCYIADEFKAIGSAESHADELENAILSLDTMP